MSTVIEIAGASIDVSELMSLIREYGDARQESGSPCGSAATFDRIPRTIESLIRDVIDMGIPRAAASAGYTVESDPHAGDLYPHDPITPRDPRDTPTLDEHRAAIESRRRAHPASTVAACLHCGTPVSRDPRSGRFPGVCPPCAAAMSAAEVRDAYQRARSIIR